VTVRRERACGLTQTEIMRAHPIRKQTGIGSLLACISHTFRVAVLDSSLEALPNENTRLDMGEEVKG